MSLFKKMKNKVPTSPLLGSSAAQLDQAQKDLAKGPEAPPDLPVETDPDILEMQKQARRKARQRKGLASTILAGGQLGDEGTALG